MWHQPDQEVLRRDEVRVEYRDERAARDFQPGFERACLVARAIRAVVVLDVDAFSREAPDGQLGDGPRLVGRIVEHLNFEALARILDLADGFHEAVRDVHLVVERELNRHDRDRIERAPGLRQPILVLHVEIDQVVPVPSIHGEHDQDEEIRSECQGFGGGHVVSGVITYINDRLR